jgi:hypothetical protein
MVKLVWPIFQKKRLRPKEFSNKHLAHGSSSSENFARKQRCSFDLTASVLRNWLFLELWDKSRGQIPTCISRAFCLCSFLTAAGADASTPSFLFFGG